MTSWPWNFFPKRNGSFRSVWWSTTKTTIEAIWSSNRKKPVWSFPENRRRESLRVASLRLSNAIGDSTAVSCKNRCQAFVSVFSSATSTSRLFQARYHLFLPHEKRIPRIRIESRQANELKNSRIMVQIDHWPRSSRYPHVRVEPVDAPSESLSDLFLGSFCQNVGQVGRQRNRERSDSRWKRYSPSRISWSGFGLFAAVALDHHRRSSFRFDLRIRILHSSFRISPIGSICESFVSLVSIRPAVQILTMRYIVACWTTEITKWAKL